MIKYHCFRFLRQAKYPYYPGSALAVFPIAGFQMSESDYAPVETGIGGEGVLPKPIASGIREETALSFLDLVVLSLLETSAMTGYVLKKRLVKQYHLKASYGTLYPRLKALEKMGILKDSPIFGRFATRSSGTNYILTPLGKNILDQNLRRFDGFLRKIRSKDTFEPSPTSTSRT